MTSYTYDEHLNELLKDSKFKKAYEDQEAYYHVQRTLILARLSQELSQKDLSIRSGIDQGNISKIENGEGNPTIKVLSRIAKALDMELIIQFVPKTKP